MVETLAKNLPSNYRIRFSSEPDESMTQALNKGLKICESEFFVVLNAGDELLTNAFDTYGRCLPTASPNIAGFMFGSILYYEKEHKYRTIVPKYMNSRLGISILDTHVPSCSVVLRTSAVKGIGGYDESLRYSQDTDVYLRILRSGKRFHLCTEFTSLFLKNNDQVSSRFSVEQKREVRTFIPFGRLYSLFSICKIRPLLRLLLGVYGIKKSSINGVYPE